MNVFIWLPAAVIGVCATLATATVTLGLAIVHTFQWLESLL